jgi:V/A-type H+/Na+-transporting ATPase subunit I
MAIVRMNKFTLVAFEAHKNKILKKLQAFGEVEFINLQSKRLEEENDTLSFLKEDVVNSSAREIEDNLSKLRTAIELLKNYIPKESGLKSLKEGKLSLSYEDLREYGKPEAWGEIYRSVKNKEERLSLLDNNISKLRSELEELEPWKKLDMPFNALEGMRHVAYFLGTIPTQQEDRLRGELDNRLQYSYFETVDRDSRLSYILVLAHKEESKAAEEALKSFEFSEVKLSYKEKPSETINKLNKDLEDILKEKPAIYEELSAFSDKLTILERAHEYYENKLIRLNSSENFLKSNSTVVISGWLPSEKTEFMEGYVKEIAGGDYVLTFEEVAEEDLDYVPTKLKNGKFSSAFESVTSMFSLPRYDGLDPTPIVAPFYFIFFGMMVADVGYGLLTFLAPLLVIKKFKLEEGTERFMKFFMYLGISTTIWGFIYGSVFGDAVKIPALINQTNDIFTIVYLSLGFGAFQILTALIIKFYIIAKADSLLHAFYDSGAWILTLVSVGLLIGTGSPIAKYAMFIGMIIIVLTNGRDAKSVGGKLASGLYALYGITGYIGDLISYIRLMALGMAGASIAGAMNLIIGYLPGISFFIVGPFIFIAIHIFNLLLGLLGAYVHSLRLQYVEFFGKFYSGGGKPYEPFKMKNNYIKVK